jgi:hypothetical protein
MRSHRVQGSARVIVRILDIFNRCNYVAASRGDAVDSTYCVIQIFDDWVGICHRKQQKKCQRQDDKLAVPTGTAGQAQYNRATFPSAFCFSIFSHNPTHACCTRCKQSKFSPRASGAVTALLPFACDSKHCAAVACSDGILRTGPRGSYSFGTESAILPPLLSILLLPPHF